MGIFDFLFKPGTPEMKPTSAAELPEYLQKAGANMVGAGIDIAQEDYVPYTDPRLATMNTAMTDAMKQGLGMAGISSLQGQQSIQ